MKTRIKYFDTLRFLAIFSVIALHVFQSFPAETSLMGFRVIALSEIFKFAVPVFLMISGALLLNREMPINDFLKRRFARLTYPFILYMIIYAVILFVLMTQITGFTSLGKWLAKLPFHYNWYFWTIASLYLAIPILSKFVIHSSFKDLEYFIALLLIGCVIYQITLLLGTTHYFDLNFFVSPIAYLILGYWLSNKDFKLPANKMISLAVIIFLAATLAKITGQLGYIPMQLIENYQATRSMIVSSFIDMGLLQIIQASALFVIFRYIYQAKDGIYSKFNRFLNIDSVSKFILSISLASYGMYLFHHTLIEPMRVLIKPFTFSGGETLVLIIALTLIVFVVCWLVVLIVTKIPIIGKYSGYH